MPGAMLREGWVESHNQLLELLNHMELLCILTVLVRNQSPVDV